jgi:allophanate hydrolase
MILAAMPDLESDVTALSFDRTSLHSAYRDGLDPREVVAACLARTQSLGDPGIFIALAEDAAGRALAALGPFDPVAKPLWGLPFAIKDNIDLAGVPTTAACPDFAYVPQASATAVERLIRAGAVPIGKTNLDQFATGLTGVRSPYPIPVNSFHSAIVPGGSSSGSAVAVARGLVTFALGTDTAGSGRIPAGLNNLVGLKPSLGAVPVRGVVPACRTLDCVSVLALTVPDAWTVFQSMAGFEAADPWSRHVAMAPPAALPPMVRAGIPDRASRRFFGDLQAEQAFDLALESLAMLGIDLVEVDFKPFFEVANLLYEGAWVAERYAAIRPFIEARPDALHPTTLQIIKQAERLSAADAFAGIYRLAELRRRTEATWTEVDALVVPTVPRAYTRADLEADPIGPNSALGTYTNFVNLLDLCALAVPGPFRADQLPSGITLVAPPGRDGFLASLGRAFQAAAAVPLGATGTAQPRHPPGDPPPPGETIELAVVGAHLSGMPLNRELVALGARFVRSVPTAPAYRLYALPGAPPRKPGLARQAEGGSAIATEVWAMAPEAFGRFVAAVPPPLAIGTLRLADGTTPKGFLCETADLGDAEDISAFGGWRDYVQSLAS